MSPDSDGTTFAMMESHFHDDSNTDSCDGWIRIISFSWDTDQIPIRLHYLFIGYWWDSNLNTLPKIHLPYYCEEYCIGYMNMCPFLFFVFCCCFCFFFVVVLEWATEVCTQWKFIRLNTWYNDGDGLGVCRTSRSMVLNSSTECTELSMFVLFNDTWSQ